MKYNFQIHKLTLYSARILSLLYAAFISIFSFDVFEEKYSFWKMILALLMHLIPTFVLLIIFWISFKKEWIAGLLYLLLGIMYILIAWGKFYWSAYVMIAGPLITIGVLFYISNFLKNKSK